MQKTRPISSLFVSIVVLSAGALQTRIAVGSPHALPANKEAALVDEAAAVLSESRPETIRTPEGEKTWRDAVARARTAAQDAHGDSEAIATAIATLAGASGHAYVRWFDTNDQTRAWLAPQVEQPTPQHGGTRLARRGARWFVEEVFGSSEATAQDLLRGDEVLGNETAFHPVKSFAGTEGSTVALRRRRFVGEAPAAISLKVSSEPLLAVVVRDLLRAPTLLNAGKSKIAVVKWPELTDDALRAPALAALGRARDQGDAIVLDLRGERGIGGVTWLEPFLGTPGDAQAPTGVPADPASAAGDKRSGAEWALHVRQPMVAVIDGTTHGGRELLARVLARSGRARLVGQPTAGRVAPEKLHKLASGALLVVASTAPTGLDLRPIAPDEEVEDGLAYSAGRDPLLERAVALAAAAAHPSPRGH